MPRFFRRLAEGVFDEEDLIFRAQELADFIVAHLCEHNLTDIPMVAVGYSNGANIAASLLLLHPGVLSGAILFRAMLPLTPLHPVSLAEVHVLLAAGERDAMVPVKNVGRLAETLRENGATVELQWNPGGHELHVEEIDDARRWLAAKFGAGKNK